MSKKVRSKCKISKTNPCFWGEPDCRSVKADPQPDLESKSGPKWSGSGSRVRIRPKMAGSGLWFFFIFVLFLYFECLWSPKRKGVKKRAKVTVKKQKQTGLSLAKSVLSSGVGLSFLYPSSGLSFSLLCVGHRQLTGSGHNVCWVPDPVGGNAVRVGSSGQTRIRSPDWCHLICPDPDLGPVPSPGSAMRGSGLYVYQGAKLLKFHDFLSLNRTSVL